ncbi:hypothetical protein F2Q69_00026103 [Brassica cretica]|uniref:Uncharacterized protein n=1 Tax=Brassica cretica TaxID=69181 RepID=A0A8S9RVC2_BRACR|nr:hypothetical protein F2Q69_00026103 [Brassica cretica]
MYLMVACRWFLPPSVIPESFQGTWTKQRFPLLSFEAFGSWSYRLAGEAATIGHGLDAEVVVTGWRAMGSSGNSRSLVFA